MSVATIGLFTLLSGLAPTFTLLLVVRLLFGLGVGGVYATAGALIREGAGKRGGLCSGIMIVGWFGGSTLSPLFFYFFLPSYGWRGVFFAEAFILVLVPYLIVGLREIPRLAGEPADQQHFLGRPTGYGRAHQGSAFLAFVYARFPRHHIDVGVS